MKIPKDYKLSSVRKNKLGKAEMYTKYTTKDSGKRIEKIRKVPIKDFRGNLREQLKDLPLVLTKWGDDRYIVLEFEELSNLIAKKEREAVANATWIRTGEQEATIRKEAVEGFVHYVQNNTELTNYADSEEAKEIVGWFAQYQNVILPNDMKHYFEYLSSQEEDSS
jgi:hypothetical protein